MKKITPRKPAAPKTAEAVTAAGRRALLLRLKRAEGQVRGVQRMVEDDRYCPEVLMQISAAQESLRGVSRLLMRRHLEHCATSALRSGSPERAERTYAELAELFYRYAR